MLVQLRHGSCGRRGFERSRRPHAHRRLGKEGQVRRSPQAVAGRKRGVEARGRPQTCLPWKTTVYGLQLLRHGRGNPDTAQGWNLRTVGEHVPGRWRSPVTGKAHRMRLGSRIERRTPRWGKPTTWGRSRRKHAARQGHASRTCRTGAVGANLPAGQSQQGCPLRGCACNRGTGCGKTARPGLHGGCRVTGIPTVAVQKKSVVVAQLSDEQRVGFNFIDHPVLISDAP